MLLAGGSDGLITFILHNQDKWDTVQFTGHKTGVTCISWAPYAFKRAENLPLGQQASSAEERKEEPLPMRFASGGTDGLVKYWVLSPETRKFTEEIIVARPEWIKDVAFTQHNTMGISVTAVSLAEETTDTLAVCSEKAGVSILKQVEERWEEFKLPPQKAAPTKVSWGVDGEQLAVAYEDGTTKIYEEKEPGKWDETAPQGAEVAAS